MSLRICIWDFAAWNRTKLTLTFYFSAALIFSCIWSQYVGRTQHQFNPIRKFIVILQISRQATINIGTIGHVAHGKSTVVKAISGVQTVRFKNELERNITIKLGYANAKIYKGDPKGEKGGFYTSRGSNHADEFVDSVTGVNFRLRRHVSFVDCPGHDILMATMLNGAAVMDAALLLVAGNEICPQPQTSEHLAAVEIMRLNHIIILQNKIGK